MNPHKLDFAETVRRLEELKPTLPIKLANIAQSYFMNCFRFQRFDGKPWQQVKRKIAGTPESKYPKWDKGKNKRGILIGRTRDLYGAVSHSIREVSWELIRLGVDVPYAEYHNEGTDTIPKRQFMGDAYELREKLHHEIESSLNKIFV